MHGWCWAGRARVCGRGLVVRLLHRPASTAPRQRTMTASGRVSLRHHARHAEPGATAQCPRGAVHPHHVQPEHPDHHGAVPGRRSAGGASLGRTASRDHSDRPRRFCTQRQRPRGARHWLRYPGESVVAGIAGPLQLASGCPATAASGSAGLSRTYAHARRPTPRTTPLPLQSHGAMERVREAAAADADTGVAAVSLLCDVLKQVDAWAVEAAPTDTADDTTSTPAALQPWESESGHDGCRQSGPVARPRPCSLCC